MEWSYGVTTVPSRVHQYLPQTLESLKKAGFYEPILFVDAAETRGLAKYGCPVVFRNKNVGAFGHWVLTLWELYLSNSKADYYAIFQDDFVISKNAKSYIELGVGEDKWEGMYYLNLYTVPMNEILCKETVGWHESNQRGKGAVAIVFPNKVVPKLLCSPHFAAKPKSKRHPTKNIDGALASSAGLIDLKELVHWPSLTQHIGHSSSLENGQHPLPKSFKGEEFDLLQLCKERN